MPKREVSPIARIVQFVVPIALFIALASLIQSSKHTAQSQLTTQLCAIPQSQFSPVAGTITRDGRIVLIGKGRTKAGVDTAVYTVHEGRYDRIFSTDIGYDVPAMPKSPSAVVSPKDGRLLLGFSMTKSHPGPVVLCIDTRSGKLLWRKDGLARLDQSWRTFSDNGSQFVAGRTVSGVTLSICDSSTGKIVRHVPVGARGTSTLSGYGFVPGSNAVEYLELPAAPVGLVLWRTDLVGGKFRPLIDFSRVSDIFPSPDGSLFALNTVTGTGIPMSARGRMAPTVVVQNASGTKGDTVYQGKYGEWIDRFLWSPDCKLVAMLIRSGSRQRIEVLDASTGDRVATLLTGGDLRLFDWYPDSKSVLCGAGSDGQLLVQKLTCK